MDYSSLYDLIKNIQYGTNLHIGVVFLDDYGNTKTTLPSKLAIHSSPVCEVLKVRQGGFERCFRCRQAAIRKAIKTGQDFGGFCINGVYEYTRPVLINQDCVCIIFIGNILDEKTKHKRNIALHLNDKKYLDTMEKNYSIEKCVETGRLIESYVRMLLEKVPTSTINSRNALIENVKYYIELNLGYDIKLSQVAKTFHYNEQYLGRLFIKSTGYTFNEFVNLLRILKASSILKASKKSVVNIALDVGFNNVTYFNRLFRRHFNCTPTEYRKKATN